MLISRSRIGVAMLSLSTCSAMAHAGGPPQIFDWINPSGGDFSDGENWSPLGPPIFSSTIRFDLAASYLVTAESFFVNTTMIGRDDLRIELSSEGTGGKGNGYADFGTLFIGGGAYDAPRDLDAPGSLTLTGDLFSYNQSIQLGDGQLASRLVLESGAVISTGDFAMTSASSIVYRLDANTQSFGSIVEASFANEVSPNGAIQVGNSLEGGPPLLGARFSLFRTFGFLSSEQFPLIALAPRPGRAFVLDIDQQKGNYEVFTTVGVSDTVSSFNLTESDDLAESPNRLVTADFNEDGRDDLVVLLPAGVVSVYPSTPTGFDPPVQYAVGSNPVDAAAGDFDGDGKVDLAIGCQGDGTLEYLFNPLADGAQLVPGPSEPIDGDIQSLATTVFPSAAASLTSTKGTSVTTRGTSGGKTRGYTTDGSDVIKVAEIEVGDDPGPSDPIEDENKKDPDPPIGVGGLGGTAFGGPPVPVLSIIEPSPDAPGYNLLRTIPLTGRAVDFVSADLDNDGYTDTLVVTENGHLDLVRTEVQGSRANSIHLGGTPTSIALGDLDGDSRPEVVIGLSNPARLELHRVLVETAQFQGGVRRLVLERYATEFLSQVPADVVVTDAPGVDDSQVIVGLNGDGGGSVPSVNVNQVDTVPTPDCVFSDFNGDGEVNGFDMSFIFSWWGPCQTTNCPYDLNGDGVVGAPDLGLLMSSWGDCQP